METNNMLSWNGYLRPRKPHFFQIIMQDGEAMRQQKFWIPRRFMREYGREILKHVQVKDPSGRIWNLEWSKSDGEIWFKKGWKDFADYYSLKHGHLLVFQYEGTSRFSVIILDMTATEIDYPNERIDENVGEVEKEAEEEYEVPLDDSTPSLSRKRKESSFKCSSRLPKLMKKDLAEDSNGQEMGLKQKKRLVTGDKKVEPRGLESKKRKQSRLPPRGRGRPKKGRTSLPSKPGNHSKLHISSSGGNKSVTKQRGNGIRKNTVVLRDDENAEDLSKPCAATKSNPNNLKNSSRNTCRVSKTQETSLNKSRAFKMVAGLKSMNPSFDVIMKPAYIKRRYMSVPYQFARHLFKEKSGNVILQNSEGKSWTVSYNMYSKHNYTRLVSGWPAFVRENNLTAGVKCIFKLINHDKLILKVVIVRANTSCEKSENITGVHPCSPKIQSQSSCKERGKQRLCDHKCKLSNKNVRKLTGFEKANSLSRAKMSFQSANPNFMVVIQPTYVKKRPTIPVEFMKQTNQGAKTELIFQLQVGEKRWPVKYVWHPRYNVRRLAEGWTGFVKENFLRVGDMCAFELVDSESLVLKVTIFSLDG